MSAKPTGSHPAASRPAAAYAREATRLDASMPPRIEGRIIHRERGISLGLFRLGYTSTDYEFDPIAGPPPRTVFADTLDAAATSVRLGELSVNDRAASGDRPVSDRRQVLAEYRAAAADTPRLGGRATSGERPVSDRRQALAGYQATEEETPDVIPSVFCATG